MSSFSVLADKDSRSSEQDNSHLFQLAPGANAEPEQKNRDWLEQTAQNALVEQRLFEGSVTFGGSAGEGGAALSSTQIPNSCLAFGFCSSSTGESNCEDLNGGEWCGGANTCVAGACAASDTTAPNFDSGPAASSITTTSFNIDFSLNEQGTAFAVAVPDGETAPSAAQVFAGQKNGGTAAASNGGASGSAASGTSPFTSAISLTGLTAGTTYDVYVVAQDDEGSPNQQAAVTAVANVSTSRDNNSTVGAGGGTEASTLATTIDTVGEEVDLFDFAIADVGTSDGLPTVVTELTVAVSGTSIDSERGLVFWTLDGPDASSVTGSYAAGTELITFSSLNISVANGGSETYSVRGYFNDSSSNNDLVDGSTYILTIADTNITTGSGSSGFATSFTNSGSGFSTDVTATQIAFTQQPSGSVSGVNLTTQPVVTARDVRGNTDTNFTETITLTENSSGTVTGGSVAASSGVATFTSVNYTASADQESFTLTADDQGAVGTNLGTVDANSVTSDVVATTLSFDTQPAPTSITSGVSTDFSTDPVLHAVDGDGTLDTGFTGNITLAVVDTGGSSLSGGHTINSFSSTADPDGGGETDVTQAASGGVATFAGLTLQYTVNGASDIINMRASATGITAVNSGDITATANNAPVVDLNGGGAGNDNSASFSEASGAVSIAPSATVTDADNDTITTITVTLTNDQNGAAEGLNVTAAEQNALSGISSASNIELQDTISITGATASVAEVQTFLQAITYNNTSNTPSETARTVTVVLNDGTDNSVSRTSTISVSDVTAATTSGASFNTSDGTNLTPGITFDSGDETLTIGATSHTSGTANGGGGTDTLVTIDNADLSGLTISNFETVTIPASTTASMTGAQHNAFTTFTNNATQSLDLKTDATNVTGNSNIESFTLDSTYTGALTLSAAAQNATSDASGSHTVSVAALTATGTLDGGTGGTDVLQMDSGASISGATVSNFETLTVSDNASVTMTEAQHDAFVTVNGGATEQITISAATDGFTADADIETYVLGVANSVTMSAAGQSITGSSGADTVSAAALTATGTINGNGDTDTLSFSDGASTAGATLSNFENLTIANDATVTMAASQLSQFSGTITAVSSTPGETITISGDGDFSTLATADIETYSVGDDSTNTRTITLGSGHTSGTITANSANDAVTFNIGTQTFSGSLTGNSTDDIVQMGNGSSIAAATLTNVSNVIIDSGATVTMTEAQHDSFGSNFTATGTNAITISAAGGTTSGVMTANTNVENYTLGDAINLSLTSGQSTGTITGSTGNDTVTVGTLTLGAGTINAGDGTDTLSMGNGANIASSGTSNFENLTLDSGASVSMTTAQLTDVTGGSITAPGDETVVITNDGNFSTLNNAAVENYSVQDDSTNTRTVTLGTNDTATNVSAISTNDAITFSVPGITYTGTLVGEGTTNDTLLLANSANVSGGTLSNIEVLSMASGASVTMSAAQYASIANQAITAAGTGGSGETITINGTGDITVNATTVETYTIEDDSSDSRTVTLGSANSNTFTASSASDAITLDVGTHDFSGAFTANATAANTLVSNGTNDIASATLSGFTNLTLNGTTNDLTLTVAQLNAFSGTITGTGTDTLTLSATGTVTGGNLTAIETIATGTGGSITVTMSAADANGKTLTATTSASDSFTVTGSASSQTINGSAGGDNLSGGDGADVINGNNGGDTINGGAGADTISPGEGTDSMTGSDGNDIFSGSSSELSGDTIADLSAGDTVKISGVNGLTTSNVRFNGSNTLQVDTDATDFTAVEVAITLSDGAGGNLDILAVADNGSDTDITFENSNNAPVFGNLNGTPTFVEDGSAQVLDNNVTISDTELDALNGSAGNYSGATLSISRNGGANADDVFGESGNLSALTASGSLTFNSLVYGTVTTNSGGSLALTFSDTNNIPTTAIVSSIMQAITYSNSSDAPDPSVVLNWVFNDSITNSTGTNQATVSVTAVNDAPALNATQSPTLTAIDEDAGDDDGDGADNDDDATSNTNNPGTDVATIVVDGSITDADGSPVEAIAVVAVDNTNGVWQYSTDNGSNWVNFSGTTAQSVSLATSARLLDGTLTGGNAHKIRFVPSQNYNGSATFTFRAWDKTSGAAGSTADTSTNGDTTAFSGTSDTASITINAINDTPSVGTNDGIIVERGSNLVIGNSALATTDTEDSADSVTYTLSAAPTLGALQKSDGTTFSSLSNGGTFTQEDINNSRLRYVHAGAVNTSDSFSFSVADSNSASVTGQTFSITIQDTTAPTITSVSIPNSTHKVGDTVTTTITVASDSDNYTTGSGTINGTIGGYALGGLSRVSDTQYTATFTLSDNGTDVAAGSDVPVSIVLTDSSGNSNTAFTTAISQSGDAIYANLPEVTLSTNSTTIAEDGGVATVTAALTGSLNNMWPDDVGIQISFGGTATLTTDYTRSTTSLTITAGTLSDTLTVTSVADDIFDALSDETVTVDIDCIIGSSVPAASGQLQTITITDAESAPAVTLTVDNTSIPEAGGTAATPTVTLSNATFENVVVTLAYSGTAASGTDYNNTASTSVTINQGQTTANATTGITADQDTTSEGNETVIIDVSNVASGGATESGTQQVTVTIADDDNSAPTFSGLGGTADFTEDATAVTLDSDVTVSDTEFNRLNSDASNYTGGSLTIVRNGGASASDVFAVADGTNFNLSGTDITTTGGLKFASYASASGTLTVTFSGDAATPTNALVNEVLQNITYSNSSQAPATSVVLNWTFSDGTLSSAGATNTTTVTVTPANDAPVLNATQSPTLTAIDEDAGDDDGDGADNDDDATSNTNNPGTDVATIVVDGSITDADGSPVEAIAVVTVDNTNGVWQYSTDNGSNWVNFSGTTAQSVSLATSARLLDGTLTGGNAHKIRFVPAQNYNGSATFTFRAWDKTSGAPGSTADTSTNGDTTAFSGTSDTASITINAINDTPSVGTNDGIIVERGSNLVIGNSALATTDTEDSADSVTYTLSAAPTLGALQKSDGTTFSSLSNGGTFTQEDINNSRLRYVHAGAVNTSDSFSFSVADSNSASVTGQTFSITIQDTTAPTITSVSISNSAHKVGDTVTATITVASDGDNYTTGSGTINGTIGGYALGGLSRVSDTQYTATFTISDNGTDVAAGSDVPVSIVLTDSSGNSNTAFTTAISQSGDAIYANLPEVTLSTNSTTIAENGGVATVTAALTGSLNNMWPDDVGIQISFGGTATLTTDYTRSTTSLTITAGTLSDTLTVTSVADDIFDALSDETVTVNINCIVTSSASPASGQTQTITITDAESAPTVTLSVDNASIPEDGSVEAATTATLSNATFENVVVNLAYSGTATIGSDYGVFSTVSMSITAGQLSATTGNTVVSTQDTVSEGDETVIIDLDSVSGGGSTEATAQQVTITIVDDDNSAPTFSGLGGTADFTEDATAVTLDSDVSVSDTEFNRLNSAASNYTGGSLTIVRNGGASASDVFAVTDGTNFNLSGTDITTTGGLKFASYASASGTLTVTFSGDAATPTNALVNEVLQNITYSNSSQDPATSVVLNWTFSDGTLSSAGATNTTTVTVTPVNDAPTLDDTQSPTLTTIVEDVEDIDNIGTTVASIVVDNSISNIEAAQTTESVVVTQVDNTEGVWQYTTDGGTNWNNFSSTTGASVDLTTTSEARLLSSSSVNNKLRFVPDAHANGVATFTFRAWDEATGSNGGASNVSTTGGDSEFSSNTDTASISITAVNDAPAIGTNTGLTVSEGGTGVITTALLADSDPDDTGTELTFTVTTATTNGSLFLDADNDDTADSGEALTVNSTFTQADLAAGNIQYTHNGGETTSDSVVLSLADGGEDGVAELTGQTFNISVTSVNEVPVITSTAVTSATEDSVYSYTLTATDVDAGDSLTLAAPTLPSWLAFNTSTGVLSATPANGDVGTHNVVLTVTDTGNLTATQSFTITVSNTNDAPVITSAAVTSATEDSAYSYTLTATDVDAGDTVTLSATTLPGWLSFNGITGVLSGTPANNNVGTHNVVLTASDGSNASDTQNFTITVSNTNDAPVITSAAVTSVAEDSAYSYTFTATDVDAGDTLTLAAPTLPSWLAFNTSTGVLSATPANGDVGTHNVVLTATDTGNLTATQSFTITVSNTNDAPVITSAAVTSATEDSAYSYTLTATDVDAGDTVTLSATTLPGWLSFNGITGVLSGTPANNNVGTHNVVLTASDGSNASDTQSFTITVSNTNDAPVITSTAVTSATEDSAYSYTLTATDVDAGDSLTLSATTLPGWLSFNSATGVLSGTPVNDDVGTHNVVLAASDGSNASDTQSFTITVSNTNDAPVITSTAVTSVAEDSAYSYTLTATDVDAGDSLTLSATTLPAWLSFNSATGVLSGTPANDDVGTHNVVLTASDGSNASDTQSFTITVSNTNDAPVITSTAVTSATEDSAYSYTLTATDADAGDSLTLSATTLPAWLSFDSVTGVLSGTPANDDVGTHNVVLTASDGSNASDTQSFTITVSNTNDAPVITSTAVTSATEDSAYSYTLTATDVDAGDSLTLSATTLPGWLSFNSATGVLSGTPVNSDVGTHNVVLTASDGSNASDTQSFTITVSNTNDAPTISGTPDTSIVAGNAYSFSPTAADVDVGDNLTFSATSLPTFLSIDSATGVVSGSTTRDNIGTYENIVISVSDGTDSASLSAFTLTVQDSNVAPVIEQGESTIVTMSEDGSPAAFALALTATDENGNALTWSVDDIATLGTASVDQTGVVSYVPDANANGSDSFNVTVSDSIASDTIAVTVIIEAVNDAPIISGEPATAVNIDSAYSFVPTATDIEGDDLAFEINAVPGWVAFDSQTGALTGTPTGNDLGTSDAIVISVSDGDATASLDAFTITVVDPNFNFAPTVTDTSATTEEDVAVEITLLGEDVNGDTLTYSVVTAPANGEVAIVGNVATYTPVANFNGQDSFTYMASDGVLDSEVAATVTITLTPVNDAPVISGEPVTQAASGVEYLFEPTASDVDGDTLSFTGQNLPAWLSINSVTGAVTGTPSESDIATFENIIITVSDGSLSNSLPTFNITVVDPNQNVAPVAQDLSVSTNEDTSLSITLLATDENGDNLTYSIVTSPALGSIAQNGNVVTYTPNFNVGDVQDSLTFTANDGVADSNVATVSISIAAVNDAPEISGNPATTVRVGQTYSFTPQFSDIDSTSLTLAIRNLPRWASFDTVNGAITGTPGSSDVTTYSDVTVIVSDGELTDSIVFAITVQENVPPQISGENQQQVQVGERYGFTPSVVNTDNDTLSFTIANPPAWASFAFDQATGTITGQPTSADIGTTSGISITVSDGISSANLPLNDITVCEICGPEAPVIGGSPVTSILEGQPYRFVPSASDANNDIVSFGIVNQPTWASFDTATGTLSGVAVAGTYTNIQISVTDSTGLSGSLAAFTIRVTAINNPPVVTGTPPSSVDQNMPYSFTPTSISDPEGDTVEFSLRNNPGWLIVNRFSGSLSGTPGANDVGTTSGIELVATDGVNQTIVGPFSIAVNAFNTPPVFTNSTPRNSVAAGTEYSFSFSASDADAADVLSFGVTGQPDWLAIDTTSGVLSGTAPADFSGVTTQITVSVSDGTNTVDYPGFTINVNAVNSAPVASNVERTGDEDSVILVAASVIDADNDILTITTLTQPASGTLVELAGGWQYTPATNFNGTDSFTYEASDAGATSEVATVTMSVNPVNDDPVATDDNLSLVQNADGSYVLDVLANDTDVDGNALNISLITANLSNVTMGVNGSNQIVLTAPNQFTGNIAFNYSISDGDSGSDSANVNFVIQPNDTFAQPPTINGINVINVDAIALQTTVNLGTITATDASGNNVAVEISGSTATDINQRIFRPGSNTVTWNAVDDFGNQATEVQTVNVRPLVSFSENETVEEGTEVDIIVTLNGDAVQYPYTVNYTVSGTADGADHDLADGTVTFTEDTRTGKTQQTLSFSIIQDNVAETEETIVLTLAATDNPGESADVTITISEQNQPPRIVATTGYSVLDNLGNNPGAGFGFFNTFNQVNVESGAAQGYSLGAAGLVFLTTDTTSTNTTVVINTLEVETFSWDINWQRSPFPFFNPTFTSVLTGSPASYDFDALSSSIYFNTIPNGILNNLSGFGRFTTNSFVGSLIFVPYAEIQRAFFGAFAPRGPDALVAKVGQNEVDLISADSFTVDSDTQQPLTNTANLRLILETAQQEALPADEDSDGDQIPDSEEGFSDTDNDGIPDYLDAVSECNVLPHNVENQTLFVAEADSDVCLQLGDIARANQIVGIRIDNAPTPLLAPDENITNVGGSVDFIMTDLPQAGVSPGIAIGQVTPIPGNAIFRIYREQSAQWRDFSVNDNNDLFSAAGAEGICPPPGSALYTPGLTEGDWCVMLRVEDGGANDNDRNVDGSIFITGGVGVALNNNQLPVAEDDLVEVAFNTATVIDVLANDADPDGDVLTVTRATGSFGSVIVNPDSTLLYEPNNGYVGTDVVSYLLNDGNGGTASANVAVTITANRAPGLLPDSVSITDTESIEIDVLANDVDIDGDALTIIDATSETGAVSITENNTLFYVPVAGFSGIDILTYTVQDTADNTSSTTVSVMVDGNLAPVADDDAVTTAFGTSVTIDVLSNDSDPDGDALTIVSANADRGEVTITGGSLLFIPLEGFSGDATITYTISDGLLSADGTVTVTVLPEPVEPVEPSVPVTVNNRSGGGSVNGLWLLVTLMIAWRRRQMTIRWLQYQCK